MTTLPRLILLYGLVMINNIYVESETAPPHLIQTETFQGNGIIGVASVAGMASRNGRVSSNAEVKFFASNDTKTKQNKGVAKQWKFSKKIGDGYAMGSVQVYPGSVVSSVASVGPSKNDLPNPLINWPMLNQFPPTPILARSNLSPYPSNNIFENNDPVIPDFGNIWLYRTYNPFLPLWQ